VTSLTDEAGVRYGSYAYDDQGRFTRSKLAGGAERLDFAYGNNASGQQTTTVTNYASAGGVPLDCRARRGQSIDAVAGQWHAMAVRAMIGRLSPTR
jgi:hypothetical protein